MNKADKYLYERKPVKCADYNIWLAFPGILAFALSSLGFLWMYKTIDELDDVNIEILCTDTEKTRLKSNEIDLLGFSFTFDTDFLNIFSILEKYSIPLKSSDRGKISPLVFAGGPVITANPAPYRDFFDFMVIGDGEDVNLEIVKICKENKNKSKKEILEILANVDGIYVPSLNNQPVNKITKRLDMCVYTPIISENAFFKNTFILEMARGCANRCGFCLASYLNLPLRTVPYEEIISAIELGLKNTNKIALLGAQISAHPNFNDIIKYIYNKIQTDNNIEMSVSSLRVDAITADVVKTLVAAGQKNITLAIEAGSERLRKVINKNLKEEQIFKAVKVAYENDLRGIKFYGMIGLPTETQEDIEALVNLGAKLKKLYKGFDISFGFSSFVPKPNTPFQWFGRESSSSLEDKAEYLKKEMHKLGISVSISSIKWDYWQAVLSRGDSSFTQFLIDVYKSGGKLGAFKKAAKLNNIDSDFYALHNYPYDKELPWDIINIKPKKDFLIDESKRLISL